MAQHWSLPPIRLLTTPRQQISKAELYGLQMVDLRASADITTHVETASNAAIMHVSLNILARYQVSQKNSSELDSKV